MAAAGAVAYPPGGRSYSRDGKTYFPGAALMLAETYDLAAPRGELKLSPKLMRELPQGTQQPPVGWWCSEKMDGLRCLFNGVTLVTRSSPGKDPKAFGYVPDLFLDALPPGFALDGELWMGRGRFHDVAGISTVKVPDAEIENRWRGVRFSVFDAPAVPGGLEERLAAAAAALARTKKRKGKTPFIQMHPQTRVLSIEHLRQLMASAVGGGGEGLVLRAPGSPYVPRRSKFMLKMKSSLDTEVRVTGYELGADDGKYAGMLGALLGVEAGSDREVQVGTGFSDAERRDFRRLFPVGTLVSVNFMERTPAGALRMPVFRGVREDL